MYIVSYHVDEQILQILGLFTTLEKAIEFTDKQHLDKYDHIEVRCITIDISFDDDEKANIVYKKSHSVQFTAADRERPIFLRIENEVVEN